MSILAGIKLNKMNPWLEGYLKNPTLNDSMIKTATNYYYIRRENNPVKNIDDYEQEYDTDADQRYIILRKEDTSMKTLTEYYEDKLNGKQNESPLSQQSAYDLLKHYYTNPLSLKELCRIHIRNKLLEIDFKLKDKIQTQLPLPIRIKNYLLFKEFNC
jgi:hypothetical protein